MQFAAPVSLTTLIGRDDELAAVRKLLRITRLLTLTGAGGSGKTRLASEVAAQASADFLDGVVWVELAPLSEPELLPVHVLAAVGGEQGSRQPMTALLDTLRDSQTLVVLDNCEHLVDASASLAEALLRGCPKVQILATSREALGIGGERAWLVPGLSIPGSGTSVQSIGEAAAVRLFVDRAQAALATFELTPANAAAIAQICRRLDGLPLAIELAAARVRAIPPEQLAARLDDAFRVLTTSARTAVPRHRTLREAIDWSYNLLDDRERAMLQRLAPFAGDFALEAAEALVAKAPHPALDVVDVLDTLGALVDKSLVVMRESAGIARFSLLETIRQYAINRVQETGDLLRVSSGHAQAYMDLAEQAAPHLITRDRPQWVQLLTRELDNIRVALGWTRDHDIAAHLRLSGRLCWFWYSSGFWSEGRRWLETAIAMPAGPESQASRAQVLLGAGILSSLQADTAAAIPWLEESVAISRELGDRSGESYALAYIGVAYGQVGDERAEAPLNRAIDWFREANDLYGLRLGLVVLSTYRMVRGDLARARAIGEEAVSIAREFGLDRELAIALQVLGTAVYTQGEKEGARRHFRASLASLQRDPSMYWIARGLQLVGLITCQLGDPLVGLEFLGAAEACRETIGANLVKHDRERLEPVISAARTAVGEKEFEKAWSAGRQRPLDEMLDYAVHDGGAARPQTRRVAETDEPEAEHAPLDVRSLGTLEILRDGRRLPADAWRYARPRELLLYLLSFPEGRTREQIGLVFWPDASATQVKNNFHVMLHHVRKAIGRADLIAFDRDRYRIAWELGVVYDARIFEDLMRPAVREVRAARAGTASPEAYARIERAMSLYHGDLLAAEGAGDWHMEIRDRLRRLYSEGALLLGARRLDEGAYKEAAETFRRAIAVDELDEEAYRRLMLSLARAGDRAEALRSYDRLTKTLRADLEAEPDPRTKALYDQLRKAETV